MLYGSFEEELIAIETGLGDVVDAKIGEIKDAYALLESKLNGIDYSVPNSIRNCK